MIEKYPAIGEIKPGEPVKLVVDFICMNCNGQIDEDFMCVRCGREQIDCQCEELEKVPTLRVKAIGTED